MCAICHHLTIASLTVPAVSETIRNDYETVCSKLRDISHLSGISGLLSWDEMVMMPAGASASRGAQQATLAGVLHQKRTDASLGSALQRLSQASSDDFSAAGLDARARANVREALFDHLRSVAIPQDLAQLEAELESEGYAAWLRAREASDWSLFAPVLQRWVDARRRRAACIAPDRDPYDVLLEDYQRGLTGERLEAVFSQVRERLVPLLRAVRERGARVEAAWLRGDAFGQEVPRAKDNKGAGEAAAAVEGESRGSASPSSALSSSPAAFPPERQEALSRRVAGAMGFDLERGRLDVSAHPFTMGVHPSDVRMTTRYRANTAQDSLLGTVHETGHALYEQGLRVDQEGLPAGQAAGMAVHESQSLLWERCVALGKPFARYLAPLLRDAFPDRAGNVEPEDVYRAMNALAFPISLIRVDADELSYPLHVLLRFELERALVRGEAAVEDLPRLWNEKMQAYLGVVPPDDARGVLQDMHWAGGAIGYFPTYTLGAMMAVQIFQTAHEELPGLDESIAAGEFGKLREWLRVKVHDHGRFFPSADLLLQDVTGQPLNPDIYLDHLESKYSELYKP
ncbi:carboxypeptidase Taq (M32) metallopeptidase [Helicosporidium sp. ATCC 50920]|nr:carboxypeptidase Taq (M32) metallopeptidase [Helicosporidium sp. ATCC 50920]|eukprot:KDD74470.1 carboxypeptidase Taq (M32) metallopeptidase [Helicosporidium sp. ATCC 50920]